MRMAESSQFESCRSVIFRDVVSPSVLVLFLPLCRAFFDMMAEIEQTSELPAAQPFDYQLAMDRLKAYRAPRDRLARQHKHVHSETDP